MSEPSEEATIDDAPVWLGHSEASSWASGFNAAVRHFAEHPEKLRSLVGDVPPWMIEAGEQKYSMQDLANLRSEFRRLYRIKDG